MRSLSTWLDFVGVCCVGVFVWFLWHPLLLLVVGFACFGVSWKLMRSEGAG